MIEPSFSQAGKNGFFCPGVDVVACHDCDLLNRLPQQTEGVWLCPRCGALLSRKRHGSIDQPLALVLTALILFIISNSFPFLTIKQGGFFQETIMLSGVYGLWQQGYYEMSLLVLLTCLLIPLLQLLGLLYILAPLRFGRRFPKAIVIFRLTKEINPWGMMEIFLLGILVALVKLGKMATIIPGVSAFSFAALIFVMTGAFLSLDDSLLWRCLDLRR